jgi:hypothetical protein
MARSGFKLKSGNTSTFKTMGSSPVRNEKGNKKGEDKRSLPRKAWDKLTQIGMGLKEGAKARDRNTQKGIGSQNLENVWDVTKKAYNREKKADEAAGRE